MQPPPCVRRSGDPVGPLLCLGRTTLEANTTFARAAEARYGPTYAAVPSGMRLKGMGAAGFAVLNDGVAVDSTSVYRQVVAGSPEPVGTDAPLELRVLDPARDFPACLGQQPGAVPSYGDATHVGPGGPVLCRPQDVRPLA